MDFYSGPSKPTSGFLEGKIGRIFSRASNLPAFSAFPFGQLEFYSSRCSPCAPSFFCPLKYSPFSLVAVPFLLPTFCPLFCFIFSPPPSIFVCPRAHRGKLSFGFFLIFLPRKTTPTFPPSPQKHFLSIWPIQNPPNLFLKTKFLKENFPPQPPSIEMSISKSSVAQMPPKSQQMTNGLTKASYSSTATLASLSPPSRHNSLQHNNNSPLSARQQRGGSVADEIPLGDIFRLIAQMKICVVRRAGSDVEGQISSVIDGAARSLLQNGFPQNGGTNEGEEGESPLTLPVAHFLSVGQQNAGKMLDWVQRKGLPIIFLNGDCIGGLTELKALEKSGFLGECLCPHQFDLVVIGNGSGEIAHKAVEEAVKFGKRVAFVEMAGNGNGKGLLMGNRMAKEAVNQAAMMRTAIEEARSNGWTVEGEEGQKVSFWLNWPTLREGILAREKAEMERIEAIFQQGKVQRFKALACQFSGFHELTVCPDQDSEEFAKGGLVKLSADRFLLATKSEPKMLENVPGAREFTIQNADLFTLENNPGKTLFCCQNPLLEDFAVLESAAILRALGNDVTIMSFPPPTKSSPTAPSANNAFDPEMMEFIKEAKLANKGVKFVNCVPTKFEQLREPVTGRAGVLRVYAMGSGSNGGAAEWTPFLEEFNTVVLSVGKRQEPFQGLGLDKIGILNNKNGGRCQQFEQQQSTTMPNIYAVGDAIGGGGEGANGGMDADLWGCFEAKQLLKKMFAGQLNPTIQTDLCRALLLPPMEYSCCGLSEPEAEKKHGKQAISVFRDGDVPMEGTMKAKIICAKFEQDRVIGLHIIGPRASKLLQGYSLALQIGVTRAKMMEMLANEGAKF